MKTRSLFRYFLAILLVLLGLAPAGGVLADQPFRVPMTMADVTIPETNCGFPVSIHYTFTNEYYTEFTPNPGRPFTGMITGPLHSTVTNLETGKSLYYNISGPVKVVPHPDGSVTYIGTGPAGWPFGGQPESFSGLPGIFVIKGKCILEADAAGHILSISIVGGHVEDVCAALSQ